MLARIQSFCLDVCRRKSPLKMCYVLRWRLKQRDRRDEIAGQKDNETKWRKCQQIKMYKRNYSCSSSINCSEWCLLAYESLAWCWGLQASSHDVQSSGHTKACLQSALRFQIMFAVMAKYTASPWLLCLLKQSTIQRNKALYTSTVYTQSKVTEPSKETWLPTRLQFIFNAKSCSANICSSWSVIAVTWSERDLYMRRDLLYTRKSSVFKYPQ